MVANLQTVVPKQDIQYAVEQVMTANLNFDSPSSVDVGGLPPNAVVVSAHCVTKTAFNAGTNNNINIGISDDTATTANYYVSAQAIATVGVNSLTMAGTAVPLTRATKVTCGYAQSGTPATTGAAVVVVRFVVPRN